MVLFFPIQQELDCISDSGKILGRIKFNGPKQTFQFYADNESIVLAGLEEANIIERLAGLASGKYSIPMQDDD